MWRKFLFFYPPYCQVKVKLLTFYGIFLSKIRIYKNTMELIKFLHNCPPSHNNHHYTIYLLICVISPSNHHNYSYCQSYIYLHNGCIIYVDIMIGKKLSSIYVAFIPVIYWSVRSALREGVYFCIHIPRRVALSLQSL